MVHPLYQELIHVNSWTNCTLIANGKPTSNGHKLSMTLLRGGQDFGDMLLASV